MDIKKEFAQEIVYIQEQFRLIEKGRYYGGPNGSQSDGSLQKISGNIKGKLNEIYRQIKKGEGSLAEKALNDLFEVEEKK